MSEPLVLKPGKPLGTAEVCRLAKVSPRTAARWIDRGLLRGYVVPGSRHRRCEPRELLAFLQAANMPVPPELQAVAGDPSTP